MVLVAMLIESDQEVRLVAGRQYFAGADAYLENRRPARDGGRDRHVGHHFLVAAAGQAGKHGASRLDAILRVAGQTNDGITDVLRAQVGPSYGRYGCGSRFGDNGGRTHKGFLEVSGRMTRSQGAKKSRSQEIEKSDSRGSPPTDNLKRHATGERSCLRGRPALAIAISWFLDFLNSSVPAAVTS